jgi:hypothetical protein
MSQVTFLYSKYFEFWLILELQDAVKECVDKNTLEARIIKKCGSWPKKSTPTKVWFVGRF